MLLANEIITKLQLAVTNTSSTEVNMVCVFAEDMVAAREYIKTTYPKVQKRGTFRLYNAEDKVCYDIINVTNDNFSRNYVRAVYFDGDSLKNKNELLAQFKLPNAIQENVSVTTLEATKEILDSVAEMPVYQMTDTDIEKPIVTVTSTLEMPASNSTDTIPVWQAAFMKKKGIVNNGENE